MVHTTEPNAEIDLQALREILQRDFQPGDYQEAQELIVGACQEAQSMYGWVSPDAAQLIADHLHAAMIEQEASELGDEQWISVGDVVDANGKRMVDR